jgi:hypothetical protein
MPLRCSRALARTTEPPRAESARSGKTLERIATALDVPVASFFPDEAAPDEAIVQAADLVTAFVAIQNPAARRTCLAFVRAMSSS